MIVDGWNAWVNASAVAGQIERDLAAQRAQRQQDGDQHADRHQRIVLDVAEEKLHQPQAGDQSDQQETLGAIPTQPVRQPQQQPDEEHPGRRADDPVDRRGVGPA